ncbi:F-box protein PP2-B11 [Rhynchospora pubera]|uniref:F-box protein PP2-B11 n=1 Tax=Rhynchospora pubera TaxID=906938 RepID=A0AAV8EQR8_9POAL|nr:F-box protein PP2-B11 [Rhynchospora pubera]KAJ4808311.1 F-box protein PP2-B11 [Rhynchospora pubera]
MSNLFGFNRSGNKMFTARYLHIEHSNQRENWSWVRHSDQRFPEVAELLKVWWLEIKARISFSELSPETNYTAHLIYKTAESSTGLDTFQEATVSFGTLQWKKVVCLKPRVARPRNKCIGLPKERPDGWMELELGQFYCDDGTGDREVEVCLMETNDDVKKSGLTVAGLEVRPF